MSADSLVQREPLNRKMIKDVDRLSTSCPIVTQDRKKHEAKEERKDRQSTRVSKTNSITWGWGAGRCSINSIWFYNKSILISRVLIGVIIL